MRRLLVGATIALALTATALAATAFARGKTPTRVTIEGAFFFPSGYSWDGKIFSDRVICKADRKIVVYKERAGDDLKIGSTRSFHGEDGKYHWIVGRDASESAPSGNYYGKAPATDQCAADRSPSMHSDW